LLCISGCGGGAAEQPNNAQICSLYASGRSGVEVIGQGTVLAVIGTHAGPSGEHEGFLVKLERQCDLLLRIEANVGITGSIPLHEGETVTVKGQFEDDPTGGMIHWTHHDPAGRHVAGYVIAGGKIYQ